MKTWEYRTAESYHPIDDWPDSLQSYGENGWELVSAVVVEKGLQNNQPYALTVAVFKRPMGWRVAEEVWESEQEESDGSSL